MRLERRRSAVEYAVFVAALLLALFLAAELWRRRAPARPPVPSAPGPQAPARREPQHQVERGAVAAGPLKLSRRARPGPTRAGTSDPRRGATPTP